MQISNVGLYIKLSLKNIESLMAIGEKIDIKILDKLGGSNYLIKIKNRTLKAYSTVEFKKSDSAVLLVEKMKPSVVLKLIDESAKNFIPADRFKIDIKKMDMEQLNNLGSKDKSGLDGLKDIASKIKNAVDMFKNTVQTLKINQSNFFIQIPAVFDKTKQSTIYIQKDVIKDDDKNVSKNNKAGGFRIVVFANPEKLGDVKIDMLYRNKKINCSLFCADKNGFEILSSRKGIIKYMLGENTVVNLELLKNKPVFLKKQIDLKI